MTHGRASRTQFQSIAYFPIQSNIMVCLFNISQTGASCHVGACRVARGQRQGIAPTNHYGIEGPNSIRKITQQLINSVSA